MSLYRELKTKFDSSGIVQQLIYINVGVFIIAFLMSTFSALFKTDASFILDWFAMPSSFEKLITRPWTIITYGFLHLGFFHILFNCIVLFFFGRMFLDYFTPKQLLSFYLLGTIFGGIVYFFAYNFFPIFENRQGILLGASAGISAIVIGIAAYIPNYQIRLRLIGYVKLWHIAAVYILLDLLRLAGANGGGSFAHLGGALFGFLYVSQASNKRSSSSRSRSNSGSIFSSLFTKKKKPLKTVYKSNQKKTTSAKNTKSDNQQKIDAILDKISKSGYDTLSKEEKEFLFKQRK